MEVSSQQKRCMKNQQISMKLAHINLSDFHRSPATEIQDSMEKNISKGKAETDIYGVQID